MHFSRFFSILFYISLSIGYALAGEISFSESLTDDESTGISQFKVYTHTISGGAETTINGVDFDRLDSGQTPSDFEWEVSSVKNQLTNNNGGWDPFSGGVEGPG